MSQLKINWYLKTEHQPSSKLKSQTQTELQKILAKITKPAIIDIDFISKEEISKLNQKYRHISQPTDVLSFPLYGSFREITQAPAPIHLGEIVVCPSCLKEPTEKKIVSLIIHGTEHLIGRHHR
jgi:probable rRNA maturation factor